jgi:hypothetical protein
MRRRTRVIRMTHAYQDLQPGQDVLRPPHVAEALVRAGVAIFPEDAPVSRDCAPLPVADTGAAASTGKRKRRRKRKRKGSDGNRS